MRKSVHTVLTFLIGITIGLLYALLVSSQPVGWVPPSLQIFDREILVLTFSGILGGLLYTILLDGKLELPYFTEDGRNIEAGIIGDILVGIAGAFIVIFVVNDNLLENDNLSVLAAVGIAGGYGGKALMNLALQRVLNRISQVEEERDEAIEEKEKVIEEKKGLAENIREYDELINQVNQQIHSGLPVSEIPTLKNQIQQAHPNVREKIFKIASEIRSMSWRVEVLQPRLERSIPIFEALVASDNSNHSYHAQLAYACKDSRQPNWDDVIDHLNQAIALRSPDQRNSTWKYEFNRAIARIHKEQANGQSTPKAREAILQDLLVVSRYISWANFLSEPGSQETAGLLRSWIERNKQWLQTHEEAQNLLREVTIAPPLAETGPESWTAQLDRWDIALSKAPTTGASAQTASQDGLSPGVASSHQMAETDLPSVSKIAERFHRVGAQCDFPPALLAAIASRESRCGGALNDRGLGDQDNAFGIMQIDRRYHAPVGIGGDPASQEHIKQAADILADYRQQISKAHPDWGDEFILKGTAAAYNFGPNNVQTKEGIDQGTTGDDYGSDVAARAQFYTRHLMTLADCRALCNEDTEAIAAALEQVDRALHVSEWDSDLQNALREGLVKLNFLNGQGTSLEQAWAEFKQSVSQTEPEYIGPGSIRLFLDALGGVHQVAEEQTTGAQATANPRAGSQTGVAERLPYYNTLVYQNEYIVPGIPLTWGECTQNMTRWPTQKYEVDNGVRLAKVFGEVRGQHGSPLIITSGFRPEPINTQVGGVANSQHVPFKALDIYPLDGNLSRLLQILRATPTVVGLGLGQHRGFLHMDIREGSRVEWPY